MARAAAWNFMFKSFTARDWAIFSEAYGQPLRIGKFGANATADEKNKLLQAVASMGADYAAIIPENAAIEIIAANLSGSHELYQKRADWLDQQVSKLVLGQTGSGKTLGTAFLIAQARRIRSISDAVFTARSIAVIGSDDSIRSAIPTSASARVSFRYRP